MVVGVTLTKVSSELLVSDENDSSMLSNLRYIQKSVLYNLKKFESFGFRFALFKLYNLHKINSFLSLVRNITFKCCNSQYNKVSGGRF